MTMLAVENMPIKDRLRELRTAAKLTQQALAMKAGLSVSVVAHIESGRIPDPRLSTLRALAKAMEVPIADLVTEEDEPAEQPEALDQAEAEQPEAPKAKQPKKPRKGKGAK